MNILAIGDVIGVPGCEFVRRHLPSLRKIKNIDFCICNAENSAAGNGVTSISAQFLFGSGVDFLTTGNHVYRRNEIYEFLDTRNDIIRPANYYKNNPGKGSSVIDLGAVQIGIINLSGTVNMPPAANPYQTVDEELEKIKDCKIKLVDFHAEATAEKRAMGFFLDGKISALFGTHTHVQTADEQILDKGTGYITDLGMTGPKNTVIGVTPEYSIEWQRTGMPKKFDVPDIPCMMNGCLFEIDLKTGRTLSVERINIE